MPRGVYNRKQAGKGSAVASAPAAEKMELAIPTTTTLVAGAVDALKTFSFFKKLSEAEHHSI